MDTFIPNWTKAIKATDKAGIAGAYIQYEYPDYTYDPRIIYIKETFGLDESRVDQGIVTEAWNYNTAYFNRDYKKHFCDFCNEMAKEEEYNAVIGRIEGFYLFKIKLWDHLKTAHPKYFKTIKHRVGGDLAQ